MRANMPDLPTRESLKNNIGALQSQLALLDSMADRLHDAATLIGDALLAGQKLLCCGNGGSACDAAHFAAEISGRYVMQRRGFSAIDLTANNSLITALVNDYDADELFSRQVQAHARPGDVLAVLSTSGQSANVRLALTTAKQMGVKSVAFLGNDGGACKGLADVELLVPCDTAARVQEMHLLLYHTLCEVLDPLLAAHESK